LYGPAGRWPEKGLVRGGVGWRVGVVRMTVAAVATVSRGGGDGGVATAAGTGVVLLWWQGLTWQEAACTGQPLRDHEGGVDSGLDKEGGQGGRSAGRQQQWCLLHALTGVWQPVPGATQGGSATSTVCSSVAERRLVLARGEGHVWFCPTASIPICSCDGQSRAGRLRHRWWWWRCAAPAMGLVAARLEGLV
jgi:hypothetical protein